MLKAAGHRADFSLHSVGQRHNGVVMKKVRYGIFVILEILFIGDTDIPADGFELHKQKRQAVDESNNVGTAAVKIASHP